MSEFLDKDYIKTLQKNHAILRQQSEKDKSELFKIKMFLEWEGYRKCDRPACNCGSYHKEIKQYLNKDQERE